MHLDASKLLNLENVPWTAACASGAVMKIKRLFGLCECPGCKKFAVKELTLFSKSKNIKINIRVCEECAWKF